MKKLGQRGFSHIEILIVAVVIIAISAVGFYVYNNYQNRASKADSTEAAEPTQVDTEAATIASLNENEKARAARTFTEVINDANIGQVFACKVGPNFRDGIKYYFTGNNAKEMWVVWNAYIPGAGGGGKSGRFQNKGAVKLYKAPGTFRYDMSMDWRFVLKSNNKTKATSSYIHHTDLSRCP